MIKAAGEDELANDLDEERKIQRDQKLATKGKAAAEDGEADVSSDDWEDCDVDDGAMEDVEEAEDEEEAAASE